jgi:hypothetical protein
VTRWLDVVAGDRVELNGREYDVVKLKRKAAGELKVTVSRAGEEHKATVDSRGDVSMAPLRDKKGAQSRWATKAETKAATSPPREAAGKRWDAPPKGAEKRVAKILGGTLVAESIDDSGDYYVPPVDPSTIAAHLWIFHDVKLDDFDDYLPAVTLHRDQHARAELGELTLHLNHWHTKVRP